METIQEVIRALRQRWPAVVERWPQVQPWLGTVFRLVLGVVWIAAGLSKAGDLAASGRAVAAYRIMPYDVAKVFGAILPFAEIAIGILLVLGLATRLMAVVSGVLLIAFVIGISAAWVRGLRIDCGCFGGGGDLTGNARPQYASELIRDIGLIALAGFLAIFPRNRLSLDSWLLDGGSDSE